jgi:TonB-like protein
MTLTGAVKLEAVVGPDGAVKHITVPGGHPILVNAAVNAVKERKYEPSKAETESPSDSLRENWFVSSPSVHNVPSEGSTTL